MRASTLRGTQQGFVHEVVLRELPRGRHRVEYEGEVLIEASEDPTFDACRALLARGIKGPMQTRHAGSPYPSLRLGIEWGAGRRSDENNRRFAKWRPHPGRDAISSRYANEKTAISAAPVPEAQTEFRPSLSPPQLNSPTGAH